MTASAQPMTGIDALWDYPCGFLVLGELVACGEPNPARGETGEVYERWLVGAGYLDVAAAVAEVRAMTPPGVPGGAGPAGQASVCVDRFRPRARLGKARLRRKGLALRISGAASDRGCGAAGAGAVRGVRLAVGRGEGRGRCRFANRAGDLGEIRSCHRRQYLAARGAAAWRLAFEGLPPGRYLVWARATDAAGNTGALEGPRHRRLRR